MVAPPPTLPRWALIVLTMLLASCGRDDTGGQLSSSSNGAGSPTTESTTSTSVADDAPPSSSVVATTDPATTTTTTSTTTTTTAAPEPATGESFRSPTGNIHCRVTNDGAQCSHRGDTPWKEGGPLPIWAFGLSFDFEEPGCREGRFVGFGIGSTGRPTSLCGEAMVEAEDRTLEYGNALTVGSVTCQSQRFGVTCLNVDGKGFRVATNEIAMLYGRTQDWITDQPSTADERLAPGELIPVGNDLKITTSDETVACYVVGFVGIDGLSSAECRSFGDGAPDDDWSPDGRSCQGADFNGYFIGTGPDSFGTATFGCTTDVSPLFDPEFPATPVAEGQAVVVGDIRCVNTQGSFACHGPDGTGFLVDPLEVSFFYNRNP